MIPLELSGQLALVTGVGDNVGFAWYIAKALQAAGARLVFACHPRLMGIVENILERDADADTRVLPFGAGNLKVEKVLPCDVSFDTMAEVDEKTRNDRRYQRQATSQQPRSQEDPREPDLGGALRLTGRAGHRRH